MTIGQIKIEALKLMYLCARDVHEDELQALGADQNYSDYLAAMPGSIHRALQDMVARKILPAKTYVLPHKKTFDLSSIEDYYAAEEVSVYRDDVPEGEAACMVDGTTLILQSVDENKEYRLKYSATLPPVTSATPNSYKLPIPEPLAAAIPYFIKAELFPLDTPSNVAEAERARSTYETTVARCSASAHVSQRRVHSWFRFGGW